MSEHLTEADVAGILERARSAAPGPWSVMPSLVTNSDPSHYCLVVKAPEFVNPAHCYGSRYRAENAAFIAAARSDVPALCREVLRLRDENAEQARWIEQLKETLQGAVDAGVPVLTQLRDTRSQRDELLAALQGLLSTACRPGDDGKYDDSFDDARRAARAAIAAVENANTKGD